MFSTEIRVSNVEHLKLGFPMISTEFPQIIPLMVIITIACGSQILLVNQGQIVELNFENLATIFWGLKFQNTIILV